MDFANCPQDPYFELFISNNTLNLNNNNKIVIPTRKVTFEDSQIKIGFCMSFFDFDFDSSVDSSNVYELNISLDYGSIISLEKLADGSSEVVYWNDIRDASLDIFNNTNHVLPINDGCYKVTLISQQDTESS